MAASPQILITLMVVDDLILILIEVGGVEDRTSLLIGRFAKSARNRGMLHYSAITVLTTHTQLKYSSNASSSCHSACYT